MNIVIIETDSEAMINAVKCKGGARHEAESLILDCKHSLEQIEEWECVVFLANLWQNSD